MAAPRYREGGLMADQTIVSPRPDPTADCTWRAMKAFGYVTVAILIVVGLCAWLGQWYYLDPSFTKGNGLQPRFLEALAYGLERTLIILVVSVVVGYLMAIPIGLVQVIGPWPLKWLAVGFCTFIRGTPLLVQLWLLYYGVGSLFPLVPGLRHSFIWPLLQDGFNYALVAFILSFAGYEAEIMRGGFLGVPRGELEAARAVGMSPFTLLRRVWLPRALMLVLPTLSGEVVSQLKSTPLAATVTVMDLYGVAAMIKADMFRTYEPLLLVAAIYGILTAIIATGFRFVENLVPQKRG